MPSLSSPSRFDASPSERGPVLARGVSSAARTRSAMLTLRDASGSTVTTADGTVVTDYMLGMGPMLLGHGRPEILSAAKAQLDRGVLFGTSTAEWELAERLRAGLPHAERVAFVTTGSEATHLAIRIARATTGRRVVVKFEGHYHGWIDPLFVNTQGNPPAAPADGTVPLLHGVDGLDVADDVVVIRWNDTAQLDEVFARFQGRIAAVILEPIPMNFGTVLPQAGFTEYLRELCSRSGTVLIFDEVLSGFRLALGGAAELLGVKPDIGVYAKAVASGFPLAVVAGTDSAMESIVRGPVHPAGTYSGHPVSVAAALATLDLLGSDPGMYSRLEEIGARLRKGIETVADAFGVPLSANQVGSVLQLFWGLGERPADYASASASDRSVVAWLSEAQLELGSLVTPRGLLLLSTAHTTADTDAFVAGLAKSLEHGIPRSLERE